jgi:hypothetical protein
MDTLGDDPITPFIQGYLAQHAQDIIAASKATNVPAPAIASAIAQEMMSVYPNADGTEDPTNKMLDQYVKSGYSSEDLQCNWDTDKADIVGDTLEKAPFNKLMDPLANDIGPANFNLGQAILSVSNYSTDRSIQADALHLGQYTHGDYHRLVSDLIDLESPATVNLVAYYLKEGTAFYESVYGPNWQHADAQSQSAALVLFYKRGQQHLLKGQSSPGSGYPPFLTHAELQASDGGPFVLRPDNWAKILSALGIAPSVCAPDAAAMPANPSDTGSSPQVSPGAPNNSSVGPRAVFQGLGRFFSEVIGASKDGQLPAQDVMSQSSPLGPESTDPRLPQSPGLSAPPSEPIEPMAPPVFRPGFPVPPAASGLPAGAQDPFPTPMIQSPLQNAPGATFHGPPQIAGLDPLHPMLGESDLMHPSAGGHDLLHPIGAPSGFAQPAMGGEPDLLHPPAAAPGFAHPPTEMGLLHPPMAGPSLLHPTPGVSELGHASMVGPAPMHSAPEPAVGLSETTVPGIPRTGVEEFGKPLGAGEAAGEGGGPSALQFGRPLITESAFENHPVQEEGIPEGDMGIGDFAARGGGEA